MKFISMHDNNIAVHHRTRCTFPGPPTNGDDSDDGKCMCLYVW